MSKYVFIIGSMRSGSTLLKALLSTREEISDLPEIPFNSALLLNNIKPIVVVKSPAYYFDCNYPVLPSISSMKLLIIRKPYDTIMSLQNMNTTVTPESVEVLNNETLLLDYWIMIYKNILKKIGLNATDTMVVRYEDLVRDSVFTTHNIFKFIKCSNTRGTNRYSAPTDYKWAWGKDDGGAIIKTLTVQNVKRMERNLRLESLITANIEVRDILRQYGYKDI